MSDQLRVPNTLDPSTLGLDFMDAGDATQLDFWTHGVDNSQNMSTSAVDGSLPEDLSDIDFLELSASLWNVPHPASPLPSSDTFNLTSQNIDPLPFTGTSYDPFCGAEIDTGSPKQSGPLSPKQDLVQIPSNLTSSLPPLSHLGFLDLTATEISDSDPWRFLDGSTSSALAPAGDPTSHPSPVALSTPISRAPLLDSQSSSTPVHRGQSLDQPDSPDFLSNDYGRQYRAILPKPLLAAEPIPASRRHQLIKEKQLASELRPFSPHLPVGVHNRTITPELKRKRSLTEQMIADNLLPCSLFQAFPASSMSAKSQMGKESSTGPTTKRKRAKRGERRCLRCRVQKEECDCKSPCGACQAVWSRKQLKTIHWKKCIDQDIRELNIFAWAFECIPVLFKLGKIPKVLTAKFNKSLFEACDTIIAIVQGSPLEAGIGRVMGERIAFQLSSDPTQALSRKPYYLKLWHPRKAPNEYRRVSCPPALRFATLILQQDTIASLMGVPRTFLYRSCAEFYARLFANLWQELKKLRPKDASRAVNRELLASWLSLLRSTASWVIWHGLIWQAAFLEGYEMISRFFQKTDPANYEVYTPHHHLDMAIENAQYTLIDILRMPVTQELFNKFEQAREHLQRYCNYWLDHLAPEMVSLPISNIFQPMLATLILDNVVSLPLDFGTYTKPEAERFNAICQSLGRIGFVYRDPFGYVPFLKELFQKDSTLRYHDFMDNASSSNHIISGDGTDDIAETVTKEILDELGRRGIKAADAGNHEGKVLFTEAVAKQLKSWNFLS
ncbi:hypothetical protein V8E51_000353 [Hyaloscypha variabilis]